MTTMKRLTQAEVAARASLQSLRRVNPVRSTSRAGTATPSRSPVKAASKRTVTKPPDSKPAPAPAASRRVTAAVVQAASAHELRAMAAGSLTAADRGVVEEELGHRELMARAFPAVTRGRYVSPRARIQNFS